MKCSIFIRDAVGLALSLSAATSLYAQANGHWQFVRAETYIQPYSGAYPDTRTNGGEGSLFVLQQEPAVTPVPTLGTRFTWNHPPAVLEPGAVIDWPLTATVQQNVSGRNLGQSLDAGLYPYESHRNLSRFIATETIRPGNVRTDSSMPPGKIVSFNNSSLKQPAKIPGPVGYADTNGLMTWIVWIYSSQTYYWSYIYQWVPNGQSDSAITTRPGRNLALGKPSQLSSTYAPGYGSSNCNDGDRTNMCHSQSQPNPWWQVDLQSINQLGEIVVYNRPDTWGSRERTLTASISTDGNSWQRVYNHDGSDFIVVHIPVNGRSARFVRIQLNSTDYMNINEIEVYGLPTLPR